MGSRPISWVKAHLAEVVADARDSSEPLVITQSGAEAAVLIDVESWRRTRQALAMLKLVALGERELELGKGISQGDVLRELRTELEASLPSGKRRR